jgi:peptide/nickel transport system permease protein
MLGVLVLVSLAVPFFYPLDFGLRFWNNPLAWADNPKAVPPVWTTLFNERSAHRIFYREEPTDVFSQGDVQTRAYRSAFEHTAQTAPTFLSFSLGRMVFYDRPPTATLSLTRPDDRSIVLLQQVVRGPREGETPPITRFAGAPQRTFLSGDPAVQATVADFLAQEFGVRVAPHDLSGFVEEALFGTPTDDSGRAYEPLNGTYALTVRVVTYDARDTVDSVKTVVGGGAYGLMGTDSQGRDLATGLLFGFPVALLIGVLTSVGATALGTFFGILSGFSGGKTDTAIQRASDILTNIPLLPILIFLIFILGQKLWLVMAILVLFGWPGLTIILRSMVLQVRSGQLVEATRALGASRWRIMFRHVFFQMAPFIVTQMIFFTPAAILAEAGLSFLGLGDPSLPTWGQILEQGFRTGGIYVGYWWWVLPPGVLIVITAMAFVLLALALEPVLNPRLRGRAT